VEAPMKELVGFIAKALVNNPKVLILDEPVAGIDQQMSSPGQARSGLRHQTQHIWNDLDHHHNKHPNQPN